MSEADYFEEDDPAYDDFCYSENPFYKAPPISKLPYADMEYPMLTRVSWDSPHRLRYAVYKMAKQFSKEVGWGLLYGSAGRERDEKAVAYLWRSDIRPDLQSTSKARYIGGCCFRWRNYKDADSRYVLSWIWLHPKYRRKGILNEFWNIFAQEIGEFHPEQPYTPAMREFINKIGYQRKRFLAED